MVVAGRTPEPKRTPGVVKQYQNKDQREIQKIAVNILQDKRKRGFAWIPDAGFTNGARGPISPERFIIRAPIIITGEPKAGRRPKHQESRRKQKPGRPPTRLRPENRMR